MITMRIVGQPPKMRNAAGRYLRPAYDGEVIGQPQPVTDDLYGDDPATRYVTIDEGGGFDDPATRHVFRVPGSVIRCVSKGDARSYSVTEVDVPVEAWYQRSDNGMRIGRSETPDEAFPLCLSHDASDEQLEAAFVAWAPFAPPELQWQVADLLRPHAAPQEI